MLVLTALYYFYYREGEGESERDRVLYICVCVRTCVRACVRARVCARTLDCVIFVFIDEVFGGCVCVSDYYSIRGTEDVIIFCLYSCMSYYFYLVA